MAGVRSLQMSWSPLKRRKRGPIGLRNLGNTCYLNSVLQCLTYTPPLANFCLLNHHSSSCTVNGGTTATACAFCLLQKQISRALTIDLALDSPARIHHFLPLFAKHFRHGCQEDAHEFLRYLIEACNNSCAKLHNLPSVKKPRTRLDDQTGGNKEPPTIVKEIFGGVLQSQVKCLSCNSESNKLDDIMDLSLDVIQVGSVKEAMRRFFQPEVLDGSNKYKCEKCRKLSAAKKQMSIVIAPNVLVIQLKRFENIHGGKISGFISFEERLDLSGHVCDGSQDPRPQYHLYAAIVHSGFSQDSGHYYSFVKDADGKWFCCNDAHITPVNCQSVLDEKAYILFYARDITSFKCKDHMISQASPRNGHDEPMNSAFQTMQSISSLHDFSKENGIVEKKASPLISNLNRGASVHPVKFNISKGGSQTQRNKVLSDANGMMEMEPSSMPMDSAIAEQDITATQINSKQALENPRCLIIATPSESLVNDKKDSADRCSSMGNLQSQEVPEKGPPTGISHQSQLDSKEIIALPGASQCSTSKCIQEKRGQAKVHGVKRKVLNTPPVGMLGNGYSNGHHVHMASVVNGRHRSSTMEENEVQMLKTWLADESRNWLVHCGWCDFVRAHFRAVKRQHLLQGPIPSNLRWTSDQVGLPPPLFLDGVNNMREWILGRHQTNNYPREVSRPARQLLHPYLQWSGHPRGFPVPGMKFSLVSMKL